MKCRVGVIVFLAVLGVVPISGCASILVIEADSNILAEEVARLPPARAFSQRVSIKIDAPEVARARKYWDDQPGLKSIKALDYPAQMMLTESAHAWAKRWFSEVGGDELSPIGMVLTVSMDDLVYNKSTDVFVWRPYAEAKVAVSVTHPLHPPVQGHFTSGMLKGEWVEDFSGQRLITQKHYPAYTHMIYRAMLTALDKAMLELELRIPELRDQLKTGVRLRHP